MANGSRSAINLRVLRAGAIALCAGFVMAACGSSSSGGTAAGNAVGTTPTTVASTPAGTPTTGSSTPASTGSTAGSSNGGSPISASSFCSYAKKQKAESASEIKQFESDTPAQLAAFSQQALAELEHFTSSAPSSIKSDVQVIVVADQKVFGALKKAGYNYRNVNPKAFASINTPALTRASDGISAYLKSTCGISSAG